MNNADRSRNRRGLIIVCLALIAFASIPLLSSASSPVTSVTIVNNSGREIRNVYLSDVNVDNWSGNQLGNSTLSSGQSTTLNNLSCSGGQVKLIGEDEDGCFVTTVVNCNTSSTWTISSDTARDCGSGS